jgi:hypothetical protein
MKQLYMFQETDKYLLTYLIIVIVVLTIIKYISYQSCYHIEKFTHDSPKKEKAIVSTVSNTNIQKLIPKSSLKIGNNIEKVLNNAKFKLKVMLPNMPSYIKGDTETKDIKNNWFYLSVEKLNPNCKIKSITNTCMNIFVDDKNCNSKILTNYVQNNSHRIVLVSATYALNTEIPFGKNTTFTINTIGDKQYLKNVETGYILSLYKNDITQNIYGNMINDHKSNINKMNPYINEICKMSNISNTKINKKTVEKFQTENNDDNNDDNNKNKFISCQVNTNPNTYLITSNNFSTASPITIEQNPDNTISLKISQFNLYGQPNNEYYLSSCDFNIKTFKNIESITNNLGTFFMNMICVNKKNNNKLNLSIDLM